MTVIPQQTVQHPKARGGGGVEKSRIKKARGSWGGGLMILFAVLCLIYVHDRS